MTNTLVRLLFIIPFFTAAVGLQAASSPTQPTRSPATVTNVNAEEFQKLLDKKGVVLLDVRTPTEYAAGHLEGALNMNLHAKDFADQLQQLAKDKTYLVYCALGGRSAQACEKMDKLNFASLYNLKGGIEAWKRLGKPIVQTPPNP